LDKETKKVGEGWEGETDSERRAQREGDGAGERKRWEISKGVVAKSSKNEIKLSFSITYISTPTSICLIVHH
jgi:hypothetical protein